MQQYWKSLYGYELPDNFGQIYCNVQFGRSDNPFVMDEFCYPIECLRLSMTTLVEHSFGTTNKKHHFAQIYDLGKYVFDFNCGDLHNAHGV